MNLTQCEYIWKVNYVSNLTDSYWTDKNKAEQRARSINGRCSKCILWRDNANNYYKIKYKEVAVDVPTKEEILNKLTAKERKILGL